jgi:LysM repeat protein
LRNRVIFPVAIFFAILLAGCGQTIGQVITRVTATPTATPTLALTQAATQKPTATPAPYTPAPTATPTITPTPVIYAIKSGDSLLKVAVQFGVSVASLQEANGITDPRALQIGQELVIPRETSGPTGSQTPTVTPTPLPFAIKNVSFGRTVLGGLWCLGEVQNSTDVDLEQLGVTVTLLDDGSKPLTTVQAYPFGDILGKDEKAPFAVRFPEPPANFSSFTVLPFSGMRGFLGSYYRDLQPQDLHGEGERYAAYQVTGNIVNTGPEDTVEVQVTVTLYDALGRVIGTRREPPEHNVILRGGKTAFSQQITPIGGPVASFHVAALGHRRPTVTPTPKPG